MGHALREACRVVRIGGVVVDLRPIAAAWRVEVVSRRGSARVGQSHATRRAREQDAAVARALGEVVRGGDLIPDGLRAVEIAYEFESAGDLADEVGRGWAERHVAPTAQETADFADALAQTEGQGRLRVRGPLRLTVFRRL